MSAVIELAERRLVPDALIRMGIRRLLHEQLDRARQRGDTLEDAQVRLCDTLRKSPVAVHTEAANEQHYEVSAAFFEHMLGPRLKYSSGYWPSGTLCLEDAEDAMLRLTTERAEVGDGMKLLDLGCGWGSLTLWLAERFPACSIMAVSNSNSQREYIEAQARQRGYHNIRVITADMREFQLDEQFDRILSIEMFEHLRNYEEMFRRCASWLHPRGRVFLHVFAHRSFAYLYETGADEDWMARNFFTGGLMPSHDLFSHFDRDLRVEAQWRINGKHYSRTLEAWLRRLDTQADAARDALARVYGEAEAARWLQKWRMFVMACSELFGYEDGNTWGVSHYRFTPST